METTPPPSLEVPTRPRPVIVPVTPAPKSKFHLPRLAFSPVNSASIRKFRLPGFVWQGKIGPAFWTIASVVSLSVNLVLLVALLLVGRELFGIKSLVGDQLIGGLHSSFAAMDAAHIVTTIRVSDTIQVNDQIPVVFDLALNQATEVRLVEDTPVKNATIFLNGSAVPLDLVLRKGTKLNIKLDLVVPVNQVVPVQLTVPVDLQVPVDIPLDQTDLHAPFVGLQGVVSPYKELLAQAPSSWAATPLCKPPLGAICKWLIDP